ncbi:hypothetical protein [Streptomyces sp. 7N604]|uniref:hypothetical protein n=1 Tax=Streptomyces sp. 7N604 TaxID=3457415 RepID=UPI003FD62FCB
MTSPRAPLPAEFRAVRPWTTRDAQSWLAAAPPRWANRLGPAIALALALVAAIAAEPAVVQSGLQNSLQSGRSPADPDWTGVAETALALTQVYWFLRLPELTLISAPLTGALVAYEEFPAPDTGSAAANAAVLVALLYGWSIALLRLRHRRRQRLAAQSAAGPDTRPLPPPLPPLRRGRLQIAAGALLCTVAAVAFWQADRTARADEARAAGATRQTAPAESAGESAAEARGSGALDAWQLSGSAAAAFGVSALAFGALARRRAAALRRGPVPVLRVLIREDVEADTWVFAADDPEGRRPLFSCAVEQEDDEDDGDEELEDGEDSEEDGEEEEEPSPEEAAARLRTLTRLREAVLLGAPCARAEVALVSVAADGEPITEYTFQAVRPARGRRRTPAAPVAREDEGLDVTFGGVSTAEQLEAVAGTGRTAARMGPRDEPARWGPRPADRVVGVLGLFLAAAVLGSYLRDENSPWWYAFIVLLVASVLTTSSAMAHWRVTADRDGLWLTGAWRVRHLPWDRLGVARYDEGELRVRDRGRDTVWSLRVALTRFRRRHRPDGAAPGRRASEEITAMRVHPELRPARVSTRRERGLPLAPLVAVPLAVWTIWAVWTQYV